MLVYEKEERTKERKVPAVVSPPVPHELLTQHLCSQHCAQRNYCYSLNCTDPQFHVCELNISTNLIMLSATIKTLNTV